MKKASIIAKLGAAAMAAVMACSSIAASAATVPNATIDTTRKTVSYTHLTLPTKLEV